MRERGREQSERGEIHNKSTLGNRRDDVPRGKGKMNKNCFPRCDFDGQNRSQGSMIEAVCSIGWLKISTLFQRVAIIMLFFIVYLITLSKAHIT
jgi:hypothetical protein